MKLVNLGGSNYPVDERWGPLIIYLKDMDTSFWKKATGYGGESTTGRIWPRFIFSSIDGFPGRCLILDNGGNKIGRKRRRITRTQYNAHHRTDVMFHRFPEMTSEDAVTHNTPYICKLNVYHVPTHTWVEGHNRSKSFSYIVLKIVFYVNLRRCKLFLPDLMIIMGNYTKLR